MMIMTNVFATSVDSLAAERIPRQRCPCWLSSPWMFPASHGLWPLVASPSIASDAGFRAGKRVEGARHSHPYPPLPPNSPHLLLLLCQHDHHPTTSFLRRRSLSRLVPRRMKSFAGHRQQPQWRRRWLTWISSVCHRRLSLLCHGGLPRPSLHPRPQTKTGPMRTCHAEPRPRL